MSDRTKFIGGSDAAGILGMSRWATPLSLWAEKTGLVLKEERDEEYLELGKELEGYVVKRFEKKSGKKVIRRNEWVQHSIHDFIGGEVDGWIEGENAIYEGKTASGFKSKEWKDEEIPREYLIQASHYLAVTGADRCYIAVLIGNYSFEWKVIERDDKFIKQLIDKEIEFWTRFVLTKTPPAVTFGDSETLLSIYPEAKDRLIVKLGDDAQNILELLEGMQQDEKSLTAQIELKKNELKAMLGEAELGESTTYSVRWRNQKTKRLETKRLKKDLPEIAEQYSNISETRVFTFKRRDENENG